MRVQRDYLDAKQYQPKVACNPVTAHRLQQPVPMIVSSVKQGQGFDPLLAYMKIAGFPCRRAARIEVMSDAAISLFSISFVPVAVGIEDDCASRCCRGRKLDSCNQWVKRCEAVKGLTRAKNFRYGCLKLTVKIIFQRLY